jgi:RNA polymerase primary sigma factor/RNA polymerase nonessential primary-like sigma factor
MRAVDRFDVSKGFKFSTYAYQVIESYIDRNNTRDRQQLPLKGEKVIAYMRMRQAEWNLFQKGITRPSIEELAAESGLDTKTIEFVIERTKPGLSLDVSIGGGGSFVDFIAEIRTTEKSSDAKPAETEERRKLLQILDGMKDTQLKIILIQRNGLDGSPPRTLQEVAQDLGLSKERVRQLQGIAERHLKYLLLMRSERLSSQEIEFIQSFFLIRTSDPDLVKTARDLNLSLEQAQRLADTLEEKAIQLSQSYFPD